MRHYLVSPTYPVTAYETDSYVGYVHPTRGRSVKFVSTINTDFVRYAKTDSDLGDVNSIVTGVDSTNEYVGYIILSGEAWRYLVDNLPDNALDTFEYRKQDRVLKSPAIRIECTLDHMEWDDLRQCVVYVKLPLRSGELSLKIVDHKIKWAEATVGSFKPPEPEEWWDPSETKDLLKSLDDTANAVANCSFTDYIKQKQKPKKENKNMNLGTNLFKDLSFGKASSSFALSFDNHITFNGKYYADGSLNDACGLTLDLDGLLYVMPTQELKAGDIIYKKGVDAYYYDGTSYISLTTGQKAEYVPTKVFGMTFYSVVKNLAGNMFGADASKNNPMANMLPFLLLDRDGDNDDLLKFMLLSQGNFNFLQPQPATKPESK